jgi:hypothetical protein
MTAAEDGRRRWLDGGGPGYQVLPEPIALEETIAVHPPEPPLPPADWHVGPDALGDGSDGGD